MNAWHPNNKVAYFIRSQLGNRKTLMKSYLFNFRKVVCSLIIVVARHKDRFILNLNTFVLVVNPIFLFIIFLLFTFLTTPLIILIILT